MPAFTAAGLFLASLVTGTTFATVGAALAAGAWGFAAVASATALGLAFLTSKLITPKTGGVGQDPGNRIQLPPATDNKVPVIYGTAYMQGAITYAEIADENKTMYYVIALSEATNDGEWIVGAGSNSGIWWNDELLAFDGTDPTKAISGSKETEEGTQTNTNYNGYVNISVYAGSSEASHCIHGNSVAAYDIIPGWDSTYRMEGLVFAVVKVKYSSDKGFQGLSPITFQLTNTLKNPALVWKDYMTSKRYGAGLSLSDLDSKVWDALDSDSWLRVCDEEFSYTDANGDPATQPRYEINGVLSTQNNVMDNITQIISAGAAWMTFDVVQGKWKIVQKRAADSVMDFTDSNMVGGIQLSSTKLTDLYNQVEVTHPSKAIKDQNDFVRSEIASTLRHPNEPDNRLTMRLDLVNNNVQAQQLGNIDLRQSRDDIVVSFSATYEGLQVEAGDVITITTGEADNNYAPYGWNAKEFRVTRCREIEGQDGNLVSEIVGLEYNADVYSDDDIQEFVPAPNINVPGFGTSYSLTAPLTPDVTTVNETSTIPNFVIDVTTSSTGGPWDQIDLFYTTDLSTNAYQYYATKHALTDETIGISETVTFTCTEFPAGLYYFKARAGYQGKFTSFSPASALVDWDPTVVAETDPAAVAADLYWTPNPVVVPTDSDGTNPVTGQKIYLNLRLGTQIVNLSTSTDDTGMANDTWRLDTETASTGLTLSSVTKDTTNDRLEWTVNNLTEQTATLTVTIRYKDGSGTVYPLGAQVLSVSQLRYGQDGTSGSSIRLNTTDQVFTRPKGVSDASTNLYVPATITLNALRTNISGSSTWTAVDDLGNPVTLSGTGDTRYLSNTAFGNHSWVNVEVSAVENSVTYTDEVTIVRVREGQDGDGAVNAFLTNETHGVPVSNTGTVASGDSDSDGIPNDLELAFTFMKVLIGGTDDTANWSFSKTDYGCTSTLTNSGVNKGKVQITALGTSDIATVEITASKTGYSSVTKVFTIDKVYRGADGASATTMRLVSSSSAFQRKKNFTDQTSTAYTPQAIVFEARKTGMSPDPTVTWKVARYNSDGSLGTEYTWTTGNSVTMTASNYISWAQGKNNGSSADSTTAVSQGLQITCTTSYSGTEYTDKTSVYKLIEGDSAYTMMLSNESHSVPASSTGVVSSFDGATTTASVFMGTIDDSANWTYTTSTGSGVTISGANTRTITVTALSVDSSVVDIIATKGSVTITKRFSITKTKQGTKGDPGDPGDPGSPGNPGIVFKRVYRLYDQTATAPSQPASTTGNNIPSGWSTITPALADKKVLWVSDARYNPSTTQTVDGVAPNTNIWGVPYAASVFFNNLMSDNYVAGTSGWNIERATGNAEFGDVEVRGRIKASSIYGRDSTGALSTTLIDPTSGKPLAQVANAGFYTWDTGNLNSDPWYNNNFFLCGPNYHTTSPLGTATPINRRIPKVDGTSPLKIVLNLNCQVDQWLSLLVKPVNFSFTEQFYDQYGNPSSTKTYTAGAWNNVGPEEVVSGYFVPQVATVENQGGFGTVSLSYVLTVASMPANGILYFGASVGGLNIGSTTGGRPVHGYPAWNNSLSSIRSLNYYVTAFN